jgi:hypothetical protein
MAVTQSTDADFGVATRMKDLKMPTTIAKARQFNEHRSSVPVSLGGFGFPIALFCVAILMVIASCIFDAGQLPTIWQETGIIP